MTSTPPVLAWAAGTAELIYENALVGMADVLREADEDHWHRWIEEDLRTWRARRDTSHHRQAYGGMGSLNDVTISSPWLGSAFEQLRHLASSASRAAADEPNRFVQYAGVGPLRISFFRCRACDSNLVSTEEVDWAAATGWASFAVPSLVGSGRGDAVLPAAVGEASATDRQTYRDHVESRLPELALTLHDVGRYWESTCPVCGKLDWFRESLPIF